MSVANSDGESTKSDAGKCCARIASNASLFLSAAIAAGAMSACAAEIKLVAPSPGATVSLLSPSQKSWREATRETRNEFLAGKTPQTRKIGRQPCPVRLEWTGLGDVFNVRHGNVPEPIPEVDIGITGRSAQNARKLNDSV